MVSQGGRKDKHMSFIIPLIMGSIHQQGVQLVYAALYFAHLFLLIWPQACSLVLQTLGQDCFIKLWLVASASSEENGFESLPNCSTGSFLCSKQTHFWPVFLCLWFKEGTSAHICVFSQKEGEGFVTFVQGLSLPSFALCSCEGLGWHVDWSGTFWGDIP